MVIKSFNPPYDSFNDRRILITGHSGFQGAWLTRWLQLLGANICGISLEGNVTEPDLYSLLRIESKIQEHRADINDINSTLHIVHNFKPDLIIHLAGQSLVFRGFEDPLNTFRTNVLGTICVLEAVKSSSDIKGVVIATSDKCYSNDESGNAFDEHCALGGHDPYSASKAAAEIAVNAYRKIPKMPPLATVRAGNVIGGGDWGPRRLIPDLMRAVSDKNTAAIRNPESTRPWQHVLDCLNGYIVIANHQLTHKIGNEPFNIGPDRGEAISVATIVEHFAREWPDIKWIKSNDDPIGPEKHHLMLDSSHAKKILGWRPKLTLNETVSWTIDWYRRLSSSTAISICDEQIINYMALPKKG